MRIRIGRPGLLLAGCLLLTALAPLQVLAATASIPGQQPERSPAPQSPAAARAQAHAEIAGRLGTLAGLAGAVKASRSLTAADRGRLSADLTAQQQGLEILQTRVDAELTAAMVHADQGEVYQRFRVYDLTVPRVHIVLAATSISVQCPRLSQDIAGIQASLAQAQQRGRDVSAASARLADQANLVQSACLAAAAARAAVIGLTVNDWPNARGPLIDGASRLRAAAEWLRAVRGDLRDILGSLNG